MTNEKHEEEGVTYVLGNGTWTPVTSSTGSSQALEKIQYLEARMDALERSLGEISGKKHES